MRDIYCVRAQNGYGQHRSCKIVLVTLVAPRGVTDLYISWGIHTEHARTAYHETCGTEYQQPRRRGNSQTPYCKWNIAQARPMSVSDVPRSLQSWVSTTHRSYSQLTFFNTSKYFFIQVKSWKTSAVRTTVWMVEAQLRKLRGTSDTFV